MKFKVWQAVVIVAAGVVMALLTDWGHYEVIPPVEFTGDMAMEEAEDADRSEPMAEAAESQEEECRSDPDPVLTHDFTDPALVRQVVPPVWGSAGHDLILNALLYTDGARVPVYLPADGALVDGIKYAEEGSVQYYLEFRVTCEVYVAFDHITEPTSELAALFPDPPQQDTRSLPFAEPKVYLPAGELLGYTTGAAGGKNWNIAVYNRGRSNGIVPVPEGAYPDKYEAVDCPFDYFAEDIAAVYREKIVTADRDISVTHPLCD